MSSPLERYRALIDAALDGAATEAELIELEAALCENSELRAEYLDRTALDVMLQTQASHHEAVPGPLELNLKQQEIAGLATRGAIPRSVLGAVLAIAAVLIVAFSIQWKIPSQGNQTNGGRPTRFFPEQVNASEANAAGFAVIAGQADAAWAAGPEQTADLDLSNGSLLPAGQLELRSGVVELELFSGVSVVVEGPANFSLVSPMQMYVSHGKVRAQVPEAAQGFRVSTREGDVVDLGTEFAVSVESDRCELHVIEGAVELPKEKRLLRAGQAASLRNGRAENEFLANEAGFLGKQELGSRMLQSRKNRISQWQDWNDGFRQDPRLVALYQSDAGQIRARRLTGFTNASSDAAIVAAAPATNRWGQPDAAIDFTPTGSRARLTVPGKLHSLTLMTWVRIHSLDRWYNSLFLTDGHDKNEPHWQIMDDGRLFFSVKKRDQFDRGKGELDKHVYFSPPFWNTQLSGQWIMLATTYDIENKQVCHFLNGAKISQEAIPDEYLVEDVEIGAASIGNWGQPERDDPSFAIRNLNGSLDEFAIFSAAMTAAEIEQLYLKGKP